MSILTKGLVVLASVVPSPFHTHAHNLDCSQRVVIAVPEASYTGPVRRSTLCELLKRRKVAQRQRKRALWLASHPVLSALAVCIITNESHWNPQAVNGQYEGVGQWSPHSWAEFGGTKFASTPLGATLAQQEVVLMSEGEAGQEDQQGQYDGCSGP